MFRDPSGQVHMFEKSYEEELEARRNRPVECLGTAFENDETRREHFLGLLREGLEEGRCYGADEIGQEMAHGG